jgi:hypothetical protein
MVATLVLVPSLNTPSTELAGRAVCPSCGTQDPSMTNEALSTGADWTCSRCGSRWDALRLATVAAYAAWASPRIPNART